MGCLSKMGREPWLAVFVPHTIYQDKAFCVCSVSNRMYFRHDFFLPKPYPSSSCDPAQRMPDSIWLGSGPAVPVLVVRSYFLRQEPPRTTFLLCSNCPAPLSSPLGIQWISGVWWWGNPTQTSGLKGLVSHCTNANVEWNKMHGKGLWGAHGLMFFC